MFAAQGAACAICRCEFQKTPDLDHDHVTGRPRGLLCSRCNRLVGKLEKGAHPPKRARGCPDWGERAERYLRGEVTP